MLDLLILLNTFSSIDCADIVTEKVLPKIDVTSITLSLLFFPVVETTVEGQLYFFAFELKFYIYLYHEETSQNLHQLNAK